MKKVRIVSEWFYIIGGGFLILFAWLMVCEIIYLEISLGARKENLPAVVIMVVLSLIHTAVILFIAYPRLMIIIDLSEECVTISIPFRKKKTVEYNKYPYLYVGRYYHGTAVGIGSNQYYLVFSQTRKSENTLCSINLLSNSEKAFKIKYSKKTVEKMCTILPKSLSVQLLVAQKQIEREMKKRRQHSK